MLSKSTKSAVLMRRGCSTCEVCSKGLFIRYRLSKIQRQYTRASLTQDEAECLKKRGLIGQFCRHDDALTEQTLQLVRARGRMPFVVIAEIGIDRRDARTQPRDRFAPQRKILVARSLLHVEAREIARAHPTHVSELRRSRRDHLPQRAPREPLTFDERDRDVVLRQQLGDLVCRPTTMPKFDGEAQIIRQARQESLERGDRFGCRLELWRQLHEHRAESLAKPSRRRAKLI